MNNILTFLLIILLVSCQSKVTINENNRIKIGYLKDDLKQGKWKIYKNGHLQSVGRFYKDKMVGTWKHYHANGKLHQIGKFENDKQNGNWMFYYDTGEYMGNGNLINDKMDGVWKWYYKNGNLYTERLYDNGKLMSIKSCFDKIGKILNCGELIKGNGYLLGHDIENETDNIVKSEFKDGVFINNDN